MPSRTSAGSYFKINSCWPAGISIFKKTGDFRWILAVWPSSNACPARVPGLAHGQRMRLAGHRSEYELGRGLETRSSRARAESESAHGLPASQPIQTRPTCSTRSKAPSGGGEPATIAPTPDSINRSRARDHAVPGDFAPA